MRQAFDFYETPRTLTSWLFDEHDITGACFEPCVGAGAIVSASDISKRGALRSWRTNDLDSRWSANTHEDAAKRVAWSQQPVMPDWTVSNTPFSCWNEIAEHAINYSRLGVALYLRLSAHEPKKQEFRDWWSKYPPTGIYVCPRFAHQRSRKSGDWATDSVTCCWTVWDKRATYQFIKHAPASVLVSLDAETPSYRRRMDDLMAGRAA